MPEPPANLTDDPDRMRCRHCGCGHHFTEKTEHIAGFVRRLRKCRHCGYQFWTREEMEPERRRTDRV